MESHTSYLPADTQPYASDNDDGDQLFETVPTQLLGQHTQPPATQMMATAHVTQPTQALHDTPPHHRSSPTPAAFLPNGRSSSPSVQVAVSSPFRPQSPARPANSSPYRPSAYNGLFAGRMAPPGTVFQHPTQRQFHSQTSQSQASEWPGQNLTQTLDDDSKGVVYSSDDESNLNDIKPATFERSGGPMNFQRFAYPGQQTPQKRSADSMADAYASSSRHRSPKMARMAAPAPALPSTTASMQLNDIHDFEMRRKVTDILAVFGNERSVAECFHALVRRRGNKDDAMSDLAEVDPPAATVQHTGQRAVDLTASDEDELAGPAAVNRRQSTKQQVSGSRSINDKWSGGFDNLNRIGDKNPDADIAGILNRAQSRAAIEMQKQQLQKPSQSIGQKYGSFSHPHAQQSQQVRAQPPPPSPAASAAPKRRRLVQGRRVVASPEAASSPVRAVAAPAMRKPRIVDSDESDDADSAVEVEGFYESAVERKALEFINSASAKDILHTLNQSQETVDTVIAKRPFATLADIRAIASTTESKTKTGKTKTTRRPIGERLVDVGLEVFNGYQAVDDLVARCEELGKPVAAGMKQWGFNAFSTSDAGELDLVDLEASHDSGIGTPASSSASLHGDDDGAEKRASKLLRQPKLMSPDITLKDYQVAGLNWLALLFSKRLSCILADDMGLGKTCQVIAFLSHLSEIGQQGPHLVVVPGSTLENWLREFNNFSPSLKVVPYYGSQSERLDQEEQFLENRDSINVVVTTYDMAFKKEDLRFLRRLTPTCAIFDEGHALKNSQSQRYQSLMRIPAEFRLLLTGTPLQNNLQELISLLAFLMPAVFADHKETLSYIFKHRAKTTDDDHAALLSADRISRARSMMTPFILRRKKHQVLKHLPTKHSRIEFTTLTPAQAAIYADIKSEARKELMNPYADAESKKSAKASGAVESKQANVIMKLRQASLHPMLFRRHFTDDVLRKMAAVYKKAQPEKDINETFVFEDLAVMTDWELHTFCTSPERHNCGDRMAKFALRGQPWMQSGKVSALLAILKKNMEGGHRTLIFSQFTTVLDLLEAVLGTASISFYRLDGSTRMNERQDLIDAFAADSTPVFMLSTKAGGAGINLACADRVVIFDSSFNPQDDVQAENRAHRVGQTREVEVVRLVTRGTIEEAIHALGQSKLVLDERVAGDGDDGGKAESEGRKAVEEAMRRQLEGGAEGEEEEKRMVIEEVALSAADEPAVKVEQDEEDVEKAPDNEQSRSDGEEENSNSTRNSRRATTRNSAKKAATGGARSTRANNSQAKEKKEKSAGGADIRDVFRRSLKKAGLKIEE